jgi:hypothetical protein
MVFAVRVVVASQKLLAQEDRLKEMRSLLSERRPVTAQAEEGREGDPSDKVVSPTAYVSGAGLPATVGR